MTWTKQAAHSLAEALEGSYAADGVVVATAAVDKSGTETAVHPGDTAKDGRFEIGSVTKTMTATVLALLVGEGALSLDDEIGRWLSAGPHGGITIRMLATHTSGLPGVPPNLRGSKTDPWSGYTFELAEEGLRQAELAPGNPWHYSNLGYQLLGLILERASGQDYPTLLAERLFAPLGMTHSGVGQGELLPGHAHGKEVVAWAQPLGAGGVTATIDDLAGYARACLFPPNTPLGAAIKLAQQPICKADNETEQALGWRVSEGGIREHSGGTGGFSACVTTDTNNGRAVAILISHRGGPAVSAHLKHTAKLTLAGEDPNQAQAPQPWPKWREDAQNVVRALLNGQVAQVHARLTPQRRDKLTVPQLERALAARTQNTGPAKDITIDHHEIATSGAVVADVRATLAEETLYVRVAILPTGELGGLMFLPPKPA